MKEPIRHGGGLAAAAARYGGAIEDWLDLSTGINPCPPALAEIAPRVWHRLPDQELEAAARQAAQAFYGSGPILPLAVPGTQAAIQLLPRLVRQEARVAILSPTYGEYGRVLALAGRAVDAVETIDAIGSEHKLAIVVNPNNPTGRIIASSVLQDLASKMQVQGGFLVVDEAFADLTPELSVAGEVFRHPGLIVFRSFGKFFGYAGLRLGFVIAHEDVLAMFAEGLGPWAVSGPALSLAVSLFASDRMALQATIEHRQKALMTVLDRAGLQVAGGTPLFALVEDENAQSLHEHLARERILTRIFDYAPDWMRIGLPPNAEADLRLAASLSRWRSR
ncbi:threonine-phosphate decarboxylase CobD [Allorhizobium sp. BGMRC 0089]|uniref:threonine-phosphate decarboxylase CobD n=1 Tax=Allorhizobium sonneratiae TaxID=2934936 RepID=UPI002034617B|nr:threonine-phosphate decarboxylase CobD [Allorhizobium sonneratiae]MCM2293584.1 threonine-phosphate decarboxylase CobD [Allorhizobium sonneratiae]